MNGRGNDRRSLVMLVSSMLIFGTIGVFRRFIPVSSAFLAFSRGILGGLLLLAFTRLKRGNGGKRLPRRAFLPLILTGCVIGVNWMLLFEAYNHTTVAVATLCYYMQPVIVTLLSPLVFRERLTARKAACAAAAVAGMVLISGAADGGSLPPGHLHGVLLGLGAAVCYAAVVILNKRITGVDPYRKTTVQMLSAGAVMIPYLLLTGSFRMEAPGLRTVLLLLTAGAVHTALAYVLYFGSMEKLKAQSVAMLSYIDPVTALLLSALLLGEPLGAAGILGAVLIIGSAAVSELAPEGKKQKL